MIRSFFSVQTLRTAGFMTVLAAAVLASPQPAAANTVFSDAQKQEIEKMIAAYIEANGEKLINSVNAFREEQMKVEMAKAEESVSKHLAYLTSENMPSTGPADADVMIVEFFDYNCGYCKKALPEIRTILNEDKKARFVFVELPILGPSSLMASQWALAAKNQGKYWEFHQALMDFKGQKDEGTLSKIATDLKLDVEKMKADAKSVPVQAELDKNRAIAADIGIQGTPAFLVGKSVHRGYLTEDQMKEAIKAERQAGTSE